MKTSELTGRALNYAVAVALGHEVILFDKLWRDNASVKGYAPTLVEEHLQWQHQRGQYVIVEVRYLQLDQMNPEMSTPTRCAKDIPDYQGDWSQGGPIIEREKICASCPSTGDFWDARLHKFPPEYTRGPTPLIAAMRCYVASKLGDEVEIPEELK